MPTNLQNWFQLEINMMTTDRKIQGRGIRRGQLRRVISMIVLPMLGVLIVLIGALSSADASQAGERIEFSYERQTAFVTEDTCPDSDHPTNAHSDGHCVVTCSPHAGATSYSDGLHQPVITVQRSHKADAPVQARTEAPDPFPPRFLDHA